MSVNISNPSVRRLGVIIGRFQPIHMGHRGTLFAPALEECDEVLVLLGSCNKARSPKNPFTPEERQMFILDSLSEGVANGEIPSNFLNKIRFREIDDHTQDIAWIEAVQQTVDEVVRSIDSANNRFVGEIATNIETEVVLYGSRKNGDDSTYYLKLFPTWGYRNCADRMEIVGELNATDVRDAWFREEDIVPFVGPSVANRINDLEASEWLKREYNFYQKYNGKYKEAEEVMGHGYNGVTVDAVVFHRGNVLLVKRGRHPGKGLYALPGGYLDTNETTLQGAMRECREETGIKLFESDVFVERVFSDPSRSLKSRTLTVAYGFHVPHNENGPNNFNRHLDLRNPKGGDDASEAMWVPIARVINDPEFRRGMFEDHHMIVSDLRNKLNSLL